ncbi:hypothetical protein ACOMHN_063100 [Nucella lapillus]
MGLYLWGSFKGANLFAKLAFIFLLIASVVGWISYCTANWARLEKELNKVKYYDGYGVWVVATNWGWNFDPTNEKGSHAPLPHVKPTDGWLLEWYGGFQACATVGFVCLNVGFFLIVLFVFVGPCKSNADMAFWNAINNIVGSIFWLIAVLIFGTQKPSKSELNYSFGLAIVTLVLQLAAGIVLLLTRRGGGAVHSSK